MIEIILIIIIVVIVIKLTKNNNFKTPLTKTYTFKIHKTEKGIHKIGDKVNPWINPKNTEIRFYATNFNNSSFRTIGNIYNKKIHQYISNNPKNSKASITKVNSDFIEITLELI